MDRSPAIHSDSDHNALPAPAREMVLVGTNSALRWFQHDYPHPLARWHNHPEIEIHAITGSTGVAQIGSAARPFQPGSFYLIGEELPHNWVSSLKPGDTVPGRDMLIQFSPRLFSNLVSFVPDLSPIAQLIERSKRGLEFHGKTRRTACQMLESMCDQAGFSRFLSLLRLLEVLAEADGDEVEVLSEQSSVRTLSPGELSLFDRALEYVRMNLSQPVSLEDVARHISMSPSSTSRLFTRATAIGFARTLIRLRISEACRLLITTDDSILNISHRTGFHNLSNFNRRFKEETGLTPRAYRQANPLR